MLSDMEHDFYFQKESFEFDRVRGGERAFHGDWLLAGFDETQKHDGKVSASDRVCFICEIENNL